MTARRRSVRLRNFRVAWELVGEAMANVQRDLGWTEADRAASYQRVAPIWTACMPPDIGADFAIENVATLPEYRRRGLISALIDEMLRNASWTRMQAGADHDLHRK